MIRLGLCCKFLNEPIRFRTATAAHLLKMPAKKQRMAVIDEICLHNAGALHDAIAFCVRNGIGAFRVNSQVLPLKTHPRVGYAVSALPSSEEIIRLFKSCGAFAREHDIRLSFHPDQFVVLNSPDPDVVRRSIAELEYQSQVADWIGADVINIHGGGGYGNKREALQRLAHTIKKLPVSIRRKITLENDDRVYTPKELLPLCAQIGVPFVYDVHHHRCLPDGLREDQATCAALKTWKREPVFHLSSPKYGWKGGKVLYHHDYINPGDFPESWKGLNITVEVEAKAKELAVLRLKKQLESMTDSGRYSGYLMRDSTIGVKRR